MRRPSDGAAFLFSALEQRESERFSGVLRFEGDLGGAVVMREGRVIAAISSAAPGLESLLLRSGRISDAEWTEAFAAGAPAGRLGAELVGRGLLGAATVEVVTQTAVVDAIFAMALSDVRTCVVESTSLDDLDLLLPLEPGLETGRAVRETTRRLAAVDGWRELGLGLFSRPRPHPEPGEVPANPGRREVLARVNGRRTTRDLAFALGRGLFPVMTDLALLVEDGMVTIPEPSRPPAPAPTEPGPSPAPVAAPGPASPAPPAPAPPDPPALAHPGPDEEVHGPETSHRHHLTRMLTSVLPRRHPPSTV